MDEGLRYSQEAAKQSDHYDTSLETLSHLATSPSRFSRIAAFFRTRSPRLHRAVSRAVTYVRGPKCKVDLAGEFSCSE